MKFRIWDGERMHYPTATNGWFLSGDGRPYFFDPEIEVTLKLQGLMPTDAIAMLATGFTDKEGKEIYEGDIYLADTWEGKDMPIVVETPHFYWVALELWSLDWHAGRRTTPIEVCGNRYENPELVEGIT